MQERTSRLLLIAGSLTAGLGVLLGAFGAHGLKSMVSPELLSTYETAVRYQMYHAFGLLASGLGARLYPSEFSGMFRTAGWLFGIGMMLFCGSLYLLVLLNIPWLGAITPLGGLAFIAGWLTLALLFGKKGLTPS